MNNPHYLYRMTILVAIGNLAPVVSHEVLCNSMLPVVIACSQDKVLPSSETPKQTSMLIATKRGSEKRVLAKLVALQVPKTGSLSPDSVACSTLQHFRRVWALQVPNIKFNVAKMLKQLIPLVDTSILNETIKPCLVTLSEDGDTDVRYFARQALSSTEQIAAV